MNFINGNIETFTDLFGNTGLAVMQGVQAKYPNKVLYIIFAKTGDFPEIDVYPAQAFVSHLDIKARKISYDKNDPLCMVFYPEVMHSQHADKALDETRLNIGTLMHEITHVKQVFSGRMESVAFMKMFWEGVYHEIEIDGYLAYPWEKEACMEQLEWLTNGNTKLSEELYLDMVEASKIPKQK